ncbi:5' nucleotidase, NT5C type [Anaerovorax sp. IOR16]|uniref:5' nucleotidase, NT5C type n=1 Tax=Anaerovorax sp. IOR16 TaxID=2773458 RepID=UPI0019D16B3C|nr:hypothetical protein [Anaerovorax sp. IOR16]
MLIIGIDVDETLNTMMSDILIPYNNKYNDYLNINDFTDYDVRKFIKKECKNIFSEFCSNEFVSNIGVQPYCQDVISELSKFHNIYYVTATSPETVFGKHQWLSKNIQSYNSGKLIIMSDKTRFNGDVLIDDHFDNLINFNGFKILLTKP